MICTVTASSLLYANSHEIDVTESNNDSLEPLDIVALKQLSLQELFNVQIITSASKKEQSVANAAAAIFVITQEDIKHSGVTTIPELLRMVPGLEVSQINTYSWDVSARGFSGHQNGKLLVLLDGRTVYSPQSYSTSWQMQSDPDLEAIERIEVIRGPGGTLWGANAVNGVINIISKHAKDTQGSSVNLIVGNEERTNLTARYGNQINQDTYFRLYTKLIERDNSILPNGTENRDDFRAAKVGFRVDSHINTQDDVTLQGDYHRNRLSEELFEVPSYDLSANLLFRWTRNLEDKGDWSLQAYVDRYQRKLMPFQYVADTLDLDFQHRLNLNQHHELIWGLGYRLISSDFYNKNTVESFRVQYIPNERNDQLFSTFIQDEIRLIPDKLNLTVGTKLEHNDFSGFEIQPNIRFLWKIQPNQSAWAAISRAVRTPSQQERTVLFDAAVIPAAPPEVPVKTVVRAFGNPDFESEEVIAYELGFRTQTTMNFSWDIAAFFNQYDNLYLIESLSPYLHEEGYAVVPLHVANGMDGEVFGAELAADWQVIEDTWRLQMAYTYLQMQLHLHPNYVPSEPKNAEGQEQKVPQHQISLRSYYHILPNLDFDLWFRYVDELPILQQTSYSNVDIRLAWQINKNVELSLVGQDIFDKQRSEFGNSNEIGSVGATEIERSYYLKLQWHF